MRSLLLGLALFATPVAAQDTDLELVLLADSSGSITQSELLFQRRAYAEALTDPEVLTAGSWTGVAPSPNATPK